MLKYIRAKSERDLLDVKRLFHEYEDTLDFNLGFQNFEKELVDLPGDYAPPSGTIVLAVIDGEAVGCVALRRINKEICEMKRLFVSPSFRGRGIGRSLAEAVIEDARGIGYKFMRLDTVPSMIEATSLYRALGFKEIEPYRYNPIEKALYMQLEL
jgi:putative acetyltransferase